MQRAQHGILVAFVMALLAAPAARSQGFALRDPIVPDIASIQQAGASEGARTSAAPLASRSRVSLTRSAPAVPRALPGVARGGVLVDTISLRQELLQAPATFGQAAGVAGEIAGFASAATTTDILTLTIEGRSYELSYVSHAIDPKVVMRHVTLQVLGSAIAKRDSDTDAHNYRVTIYSVHLAEASHADSALVRRLIKGAFLHDVGKIGVRDDVLLKPGRLDAQEFETMKTHVTHGMDIIARSEWLQDAGEVIGDHHEKYDGAGYRHGLQGEAIPLTARIFAVADVFDALTSERPYKKPMAVEESLAILRQGAGKHFDPGLVARFATVAGALHARFGNDYEAARRELARIIERYFQADLGVVLEEATPVRK